MDLEHFESAYQEEAPWDISVPQPAIVSLEAAGLIRGPILDVGCGTGENALYLASRAHDVWGLDFVLVAIERAKAKAHARGLSVRFQVGDALKLDQLGRTFDTAIDCGLFHTFIDDEQRRDMQCALLAAISFVSPSPNAGSVRACVWQRSVGIVPNPETRRSAK